MAFSDAMGISPAQTTAPATDASAQVADDRKAKAAKAKKEVANLTATGAAKIAAMSDEQKASLGSKSDDIQFVAVLWDGVTQEAYHHLGNIIKDGYKVVGYRFKALADIDVPVSPIVSAKQLTAPNKTGEVKHIKAGETFDLDIAETTMLITRDEYAGKFSGGASEGADPVYISAKYNTSANTYNPQLRKDNKAGSIKVGAIKTGHKTADGKIEPLPEFAEKFGKVYERTQRVASRRGTGSGINNVQALAVALQSLYN